MLYGFLIYVQWLTSYSNEFCGKFKKRTVWCTSSGSVSYYKLAIHDSSCAIVKKIYSGCKLICLPPYMYVYLHTCRLILVHMWGTKQFVLFRIFVLRYVILVVAVYKFVKLWFFLIYLISYCCCMMIIYLALDVLSSHIFYQISTVWSSTALTHTILKLTLCIRVFLDTVFFCFFFPIAWCS